jgi:hypothetical protein
MSRIRPLTDEELAELRGHTRFAEKRSAEKVLRMALATVDRYRAALETVAQYDGWAAEWLRARSLSKNDSP